MSAELPANRQVWGTIFVSFCVACLVFVLFVLPAEFNNDPTGVGNLLGIKGMSQAEVSSLNLVEAPLVSDQIKFVLLPFESIEYKYDLRQGDGIVYEWRSNGELVFDFHAEEVGTLPEDSA